MVSVPKCVNFFSAKDALSWQGFHPDEYQIAKKWQETIASEGFKFELVSGDVADFDSSKVMVEEVVNRFGSVDILVNCAGITRDKMLRKMEEHMWEDVLSTNLDSAFNVTRHVVDGMLNREFGRIVNISSVNGQKGQFGQTNYSAAKAGMHGFTMALAQEVAYKGSHRKYNFTGIRRYPDDPRDAGRHSATKSFQPFPLAAWQNPAKSRRRSIFCAMIIVTISPGRIYRSMVDFT